MRPDLSRTKLKTKSKAKEDKEILQEKRPSPGSLNVLFPILIHQITLTVDSNESPQAVISWTIHGILRLERKLFFPQILSDPCVA